MDRAGKKELIESLHASLKDTGTIVVAHYAGMTVAHMNEFRKRVKAAGGSVKVTKNRLAKLSLKDTDAAGIIELFKGPTVVAFSKDPVTAARVAVKYAKDNDKLVILGGTMGKDVLTPAAIKALAELPSLDELRARLAGLLNAPATKIARILMEPGGQLARVIQAKASKTDAADTADAA